VTDQLVILMEYSLDPRRIEVIYSPFAPKIISFVLSMLYIKHYVLILPLSIAICEI